MRFGENSTFPAKILCLSFGQDASGVFCMPQKPNFIRMKNSISLIIADDHEIFRDGLALMLAKQESVKLVGQASDGHELLQLVEDTKPDMVLTDIKMPRLDGISAAKI